jgi:hypothetical protein
MTCDIKGCSNEVMSYISMRYSPAKRIFYKKCSKHHAVRGTRNNKVRFTDHNGYVYVRVAGYNPTNADWVAEHRYVLEKKIDRKLRKGESVHHINGIRDDNRPENLELWVGAIRYGQRATDITCQNCGEPYLIALDEARGLI